MNKIPNKIIREDIEFIVSHNLPWDRFNNATVLISGANGFLPAYMVETLLYLNDKYDKKIKVIALARNREKTLKRFYHHKNRNDLEFIFQDVCEPVKIKKNKKVDFIIHAASQASPRYYETDPIGTLSANIIGTINLLKIAEKEHCKGFLYLSTGGVYGRVEENHIPMKEDDYGYLDPTDIKACYNESKRMGENICVSWFHQYGIPTVIVRISYIYGPGMHLNAERVFPSFVSDVVNHRDILIASDGSATRSFCYIADATLAFFTVLLKGRNGEAYNIGAEKETSILELANVLVRLFPENNIKIIKNPAKQPVNTRSLIQRSLLDISKIKSLGWEPAFDLDKGCQRTMLSYKEANI
jgi:nucleoside-diphosphate-sugar epimerase